MTERELLAGYVAGSGECFAKLVALHVNLVYSVALRQVGEWNAAEDVTQEVFLRLARKAKEIQPEVPLAGVVVHDDAAGESARDAAGMCGGSGANRRRR